MEEKKYLAAANYYLVVLLSPRVDLLSRRGDLPSCRGYLPYLATAI
jgi:hypothetical protein